MIVDSWWLMDNSWWMMDDHSKLVKNRLVYLPNYHLPNPVSRRVISSILQHIQSCQASSCLHYMFKPLPIYIIMFVNFVNNVACAKIPWVIAEYWFDIFSTPNYFYIFSAKWSGIARLQIKEGKHFGRSLNPLPILAVFCVKMAPAQGGLKFWFRERQKPLLFPSCYAPG